MKIGSQPVSMLMGKLWVHFWKGSPDAEDFEIRVKRRPSHLHLFVAWRRAQSGSRRDQRRERKNRIPASAPSAPPDSQFSINNASSKGLENRILRLDLREKKGRVGVWRPLHFSFSRVMLGIGRMRWHKEIQGCKSEAVSSS